MSARTVEVPRPEKVLFGDRITKADLGRLRRTGRRCDAGRAAKDSMTGWGRIPPGRTPLHWDELADSATRPQRWTLNNLPDRLQDLGGDPWREIAKSARGLSAAQKRLSSLA